MLFTAGTLGDRFGRSSSPMLDVCLFSNKRFSVSSLAMMLIFLTMFGFFFVASAIVAFILAIAQMSDVLDEFDGPDDGLAAERTQLAW